MANSRTFKAEPITEAELRARKRNKLIMTAGVVALAVLVLAGGIYVAWMFTPLSLPMTAEEGAANIGSARFQRMPEYRQEEYVRRTFELARSLPPDQRRDIMQNVNRDEMREIMDRRIVERTRELAKTPPEERVMPWGRPGGGPPGGRLGGGEGDRRAEDRGERPQRSSDDAGAERSERAGGEGDRGDGDRPRGDPAHRQERFQRMIQEGNAQTGGLIGEFFRSMREAREAQQNNG